eukprot:gene10549-3068_t
MSMDLAFGELGDRTKTSKSTPTLMSKENHLISKIYKGSQVSFVLKNFSKAFGMGENNRGEIGDAVPRSDLNPTGNNSFGKLALGSGAISLKSFHLITHSVVHVVAGYQHSLITTKNSSIFSFEIILTISNASQICVGLGHTMVLLQNGTVFSFGFNAEGKLGDGNNTNQNSPVPLASENWGIISIAAGQYHSMILKSNGMVYTYVFNACFNLGDGTKTARYLPTLVKNENSNIIKIAA